MIKLITLRIERLLALKYEEDSEILSEVFDCIVMIGDRDKIINCNGVSKKNYLNVKFSNEILDVVDSKKEWKLKNAARDAARIPVGALRTCLTILAETDTALKLRSGEEWVLLEQTVARLTEALR